MAEALGYSDPQKAIRMHVDDDDKLTGQIVVSGQNRNVIIINESGLYSLILSSKLEQAKAFKRWVTSEVLPAIRKTVAALQQMLKNWKKQGLIVQVERDKYRKLIMLLSH